MGVSIPTADRRYVNEMIGFGFRGSMGENELEEGEAYYHGEPDAELSSLSYIEERLHGVLGHLQKDFEGEVSAENLGAKFGGYGSFLPTYQRSPTILSQPKTPPKVQSHIPPKSPSIPSSEDFLQDLNFPPHPLHSRNSRPVEPRSLFLEKSTKRDSNFSDAQVTEGPILKDERINKYTNATDQRSLKVRIKVGSDSSSARKNAELYSGLGLDISPSPSPEDSPSGSGDLLSPGYRDETSESFARILQIMTSPLLCGGYLLSPLPENSINLTKREKHHIKDSKSSNTTKIIHESPTLLTREPMTLTGGKVHREKKTKIVGRSRQPNEVRNANPKNTAHDTNHLEKVSDNEKALKSSCPSNSRSSLEKMEREFSVDIERGSGKTSVNSMELNQVVAKDIAISCDLVKEGSLDNGNNELLPSKNLDSKTHYADTPQKIKKSCSRDILFNMVKDDENTGEDKRKVDPGEFKGMIVQNSGSAEPPRQKLAVKATSCEKNKAVVPKQKENKKKLNCIQANDMHPIDFSKRSEGSLSSMKSKDKHKKSKDRDPFLDRGKDNTKPCGSNTTLSRDTGHLMLKHDGSKVDSSELHSKCIQSDFKHEIKSESRVSAQKFKEKSCGKKIVESLPSSKENVKAPVTASTEGDGLTSEAVAPLPVVIEDNWVCCDSCQKWRLLPFGLNPDDLPKKWLCSMLYWLPGMNKCIFTEEQTTKALNDLYQLPAPDSQHQVSGAISGVTLADTHHEQSHELNSHGVLGNGKKKHGSRDLTNSLSQSTHHSVDKNLQVCARKGSSNVVNQAPLDSHVSSKAAHQLPSFANVMPTENHQHRQKDKHRIMEQCSSGGNYSEQNGKHLKFKSKRVDSQDDSRSKKSKNEDLHYTDDACHSNQDVIEKTVPCKTDDMLAKATGKKKKKHNDAIFSKELILGDGRGKSSESRKKLMDQAQSPLDDEYKMVTSSSKISMKKRKMKECQDHQGRSDAATCSGNPLESFGCEKDEVSWKKKARLLKTEEKGYNFSAKDESLDKQGNVRKKKAPGSVRREPQAFVTEECRGSSMNENHQGRQQGESATLQAMDGEDSLKRSLGYGQPLPAATSSSSKVSGSRKRSTNLQVKSSPVESVSSSPLKSFNNENPASMRIDIMGRSEMANVGLPSVVSPRQCSDAETDDHINGYGVARKNKGSFIQHAIVKRQRVGESMPCNFDEKVTNQISSKETNDRKCSRSLDGMDCYPHSGRGNASLASRSAEHIPYPPKVQDVEHDSEKSNRCHSTNGSNLQKAGKNSSRSKDKRKNARSDFDKGKVSEDFHPSTNVNNGYEARIKSHGFSPYHKGLRDGRNDCGRKSTIELGKDDKNCVHKKDLMTELFGDEKKDSHSKAVMPENSDSLLPAEQQTDIGSRFGKAAVNSSKKLMSNLQQNQQYMISNVEKSTNQFQSESTDPEEMTSEKGKSIRHPLSGDRQESKNQNPHGMSTQFKDRRSDLLPIDASRIDALKEMKQPRRSKNQNAVNHSLRNPTAACGFMSQDLDANVPLKMDSDQAADIVLKEAKDLKHSADRSENGGLEVDRTDLYFQAALKFLYGASLLEPSNIESAKHGEMTQSMQLYIDTANLCEFCAREYERSRQMAAAALAYKCMEVAHMKVIYSKQYTVGKYRQELQSVLQGNPLGESPSSSASDLDNLNNQASVGKVASIKGVSSSQTAGNLVITSRNRISMLQLLQYVHHMNSAVEALKKSQKALAAATAGTEEAGHGVKGISSVKVVLEFNSHDVEGLLHLVRLALEAIDR